ncbi:kinase-like protein [Choiromyces venosus 120613-1]|uniref:Kinase-like protein n=1 Tax=Choiromyces venosus 120613-1 TaxID=1336337 RepID=A0A3N4K1S9_9PEZI|nr:kinase-like protein [Choiromyces venosus 120613-1]
MPRVTVQIVPTQKIPPRVHPLKRYPKACRIYSRNNHTRQIYDLGNGQLYKFRPHKRGIYESDIHTLIQSITDIPIPTIYYEWVTVEDDGRGGGGVPTHHMIMEKVVGEPLYKVWVHMDQKSKERLAFQFANYINELRRISRPAICSFDGGPLHDEHGVLFDQKNTAQGPFPDNQSLWVALTSHLHHTHSRTIRQALLDLSTIMPQGLPAVLTHADLHQGNILVHNGNIAGIIDWEGAGFFPSWMEYVRYYPVRSTSEFEFENLVIRHMKAYPAARRFKDILDALRASDPGSVEWAVRELRAQPL